MQRWVHPLIQFINNFSTAGSWFQSDQWLKISDKDSLVKLLFFWQNWCIFMLYNQKYTITLRIYYMFLSVFACHITDKKQVHKSFDIKTELS